MKYSKIEDFLAKVEDFFLATDNDKFIESTAQLGIVLFEDHNDYFRSTGIIEMTAGAICAVLMLHKDLHNYEMQELYVFYDVDGEVVQKVAQEVAALIDLENNKDSYPLVELGDDDFDDVFTGGYEGDMFDPLSENYIDDEERIVIVEFTFLASDKMPALKDIDLDSVNKIIENYISDLEEERVEIDLNSYTNIHYSLQEHVSKKIRVRVRAQEQCMDDLDLLFDSSAFKRANNKMICSGFNRFEPNEYYITNFMQDALDTDFDLDPYMATFNHYTFDRNFSLYSCNVVLEKYPNCIEAELCKIGWLYDPEERLTGLEIILERIDKDLILDKPVTTKDIRENVFLRLYSRVKLLMAIEFYDAGYEDEGKETFQQLLAFDPEDEQEVRALLLEKYLLKGEWLDVKKMFKTYRNETNLLFIYGQFIQFYYSLGKTAKTKKAIIKAINTNPIPFAIILDIDLYELDFPVDGTSFFDAEFTLNTLLYYCEKDSKFMDYVFKILFESGEFKDFLQEDPLDDLINNINLN